MQPALPGKGPWQGSRSPATRLVTLPTDGVFCAAGMETGIRAEAEMGPWEQAASQSYHKTPRHSTHALLLDLRNPGGVLLAVADGL